MTRSEISQYLMKAAFMLSLYFILEYCLSVYTMSHIQLTSGAFLLLSCLVLVMRCGTPVGLYYILRGLRRQLNGAPFPGIVAWSLGVRVMLFAALPEAAFIYVYNQFFCPDTQRILIEQTVEMLRQMQTIAGGDFMAQTLDIYRQAEFPTAIQTAINMLSQDVMVGLLLMLIIAPIVRSKGTATPTQNTEA